MIRAVIIITLLFTSVFSMGQTQGEINKTDEKGRKQGKWIKNYEGTKKKRYAGHFKDDKPVGEFVYYYSSGNASAVTMFQDAGKIAYTKMYFESGNLMARGKYVEQQKDSVWWYFTEDKKMLSREIFSNGKLNGETVVYFPTDPKTEKTKVFELTNYKMGLKHGDWKQFYKNGRVKAEGVYLDGNYDGRVRWYFSNGKVETDGYYKHAVKNGFWKFYLEDGTLEKKIYYINGEVLEGKKLEEHLTKLKANKK